MTLVKIAQEGHPSSTSSGTKKVKSGGIDSSQLISHLKAKR